MTNEIPEMAGISGKCLYQTHVLSVSPYFQDFSDIVIFAV